MNSRKSNIELLRIIATFFIVVVHCNGWFLIEVAGNYDWFANNTITSIWRIMIHSVTNTGVNLFVLISGYFSIRPKLKSLVNLFTLLLFIYVISYFLNCSIKNIPVTLPDLAYCCMAFSKQNWFIQSYLFLMLLSPMINTFMDSLTERKATLYFAVFIILAFYFGCLKPSQYFYFNKGYSVTSLLLIYINGRYIRLFLENRLRTISAPKLGLLYAISVIICMLLLIIDEKGTLLSYCSPIVLLSSTLLFMLFTRFDFSNSFVNYVGSSCLAVFILHTSQPVLGWLSKIDAELFANETLPVWIFYMMVIILLVFCVAIVLDKVRYLIFKPVVHAANKADQILEGVINQHNDKSRECLK